MKHRDLAARNVLLRRLGEQSTFQCVLSDMGLARLYDREQQYQKTQSATFPLKVFSIFLKVLNFINVFLIE
jgi:hypothetical protein